MSLGKEKRQRVFVILACAIIIVIIVASVISQLNSAKAADSAEYEHFVPVSVQNGNAPMDIPGENTELSVDEAVSSETKTILIDAGHGGIDPGCNFDDILESHINLSIALKLKEKLEAAGYHVEFTREDDIYLSLKERVNITSNSTADMFISIHQNSLENDTVTNGMEVWYNADKHIKNEELAQYVQTSAASTSGAKNRGLKPNTSLAVLKNAEVPACLIEVGFLSSTAERALLVSEDYQDKVADGIANGIHNFWLNNGEYE